MNLFSCMRIRTLVFISAFAVITQASDLGVPQVVLAWQDNSSDESGFKIERSESGGPFIQVGIVDADVTTYFDRAVKLGVQYSYRVRAFNSFGDSTPTNVVTATPTSTLAAPPSNVKIRVATSSSE